jgi:hypothetical protein
VFKQQWIFWGSEVAYMYFAQESTAARASHARTWTLFLLALSPALQDQVPFHRCHCSNTKAAAAAAAVCIQVEGKYGHSSTGDPAFPKQQWPSPAECPKCRLPSDTAVQPGSTGSTDQAAVAWNEDEVYRFLVKHYGRHADTPLAAGAKELSSSRERATGGGSAIMQAALEAEEDASPGGYFGSVFTMAAICSVFVFVVLVMWARSAFGLTRRPSGGKGTWSLGHRYGAANGMPRHGRSMMRGKVAF